MIDFNNVKNRLEIKWGKFTKIGHYYECGEMPFVSRQARLHLLFDPIGEEEIDDIETYSKITLPKELRDIYKVTNGCRLFFGSLNIYGYQKYDDEIFEPYSIIDQNYSVFNEAQDKGKDISQFFIIGSLGGDYMFAMKRDELTKVYTIKRADNEILQTFSNIEEMFNHYFNALYDEYNEKCEKIHFEQKHSKTPILKHLTAKIINKGE